MREVFAMKFTVWNTLACAILASSAGAVFAQRNHSAAVDTAYAYGGYYQDAAPVPDAPTASPSDDAMGEEDAAEPAPQSAPAATNGSAACSTCGSADACGCSATDGGACATDDCCKCYCFPCFTCASCPSYSMNIPLLVLGYVEADNKGNIFNVYPSCCDISSN